MPLIYQQTSCPPRDKGGPRQLGPCLGTSQGAWEAPLPEGLESTKLLGGWDVQVFGHVDYLGP